MKKVTIVVVGSLILIALVYVIGMPIYKSVFSQVKINEERTVEADRIDSLNIQTSSANVEIGSDTTKQIKVKLEGSINKKLKDQYHLKVEEMNGQLEIEYLSNENLVGLKLGSEKDLHIQIIVPEKVYRQLRMNTSSGNITVNNIFADKIELTTTSGNQTVEGTETRDAVAIKSTSGDVKLAHNTMNSFTVNSTSGYVETEGVTSKSGQIHTTSGGVTMKIKNIIEKVNVLTTSGDVEVDYEKNPESLRVEFRGDSGKSDIKLQDIMYKDKNKHLASGVIGKGTNQLKVKTTSGDFTVQ